MRLNKANVTTGSRCHTALPCADWQSHRDSCAPRPGDSSACGATRSKRLSLPSSVSLRDPAWRLKAKVGSRFVEAAACLRHISPPHVVRILLLQEVFKHDSDTAYICIRSLDRAETTTRSTPFNTIPTEPTATPPPWMTTSTWTDGASVHVPIRPEFRSPLTPEQPNLCRSSPLVAVPLATPFPITSSTESPTQSFFGALGCACAIIFTVFGSSYGTAKSAGAIFSSGVIRPDRLMQNT